MSQRQWVAIVGSRDYPNLAAVTIEVSTLPVGTVVVTGDARGVDQAAISQARNMGLEHYSLVPCWTLLGAKAGPYRNEAIVRMVDRVIAFWDGESRGTKSTIDLAERYGKPVEVIRP